MESINTDHTNEEFHTNSLRASAQAGNADAQYELGACYRLGLGMQEDAVQAV